MKYISINNIESENELLNNDFKNSNKYVNVRLGETFLFIKNGFKTFYISYETMKYVFRRVKVVNMGKREIHVDYLVIADKRKEFAEIKLAGHNIAVEIMEQLKNKAPNANFTCPERLKH